MSKVIAYGILIVLALCFIVPWSASLVGTAFGFPTDSTDWYDDCVQQGHGCRDGH